MQTFTCPMHPEIVQLVPGKCPKCGMDLIEKPAGVVVSGIKGDDYAPLAVIIGIILSVIAVLGYEGFLSGDFSWHMVMMHFMAGFFIVFAGFKLLDLQGFAEGYRTYDLIATKVPAYGLIYPFIELGLGLLYLGGMNTFALHLFTFILMTVNGMGVVIKLLKKEAFQCACLGTFLKVPLTKVSLIEDFGMALMALAMIV